jgi:phenylpropionate dioxygenase-like ring-hydroxylating dioxygenase large terminal subunit
MNKMSQPRADRCPGVDYTEMLENDSRRAPDYLFEESTQDLGNDPISTESYTSPEFLEQEFEKMWPNVWQFAAREEELPKTGDTVVYDIGDKSFLLVRQRDGEIKAFYNVCLHRGRKLRTSAGATTQLKCPFHGFTWNHNGSIKEIPCEWDFQHLKEKNMSLPEVRVNRWQGFIMITENADIPEFVEWVGTGIEHYENWRLDECYTAVWAGRVIPANWKACAEAFMEAWHSITTHPQLLPFLGDANTRYDLYGDFMNRAITPSGVLSPHLAGKDQQYVLDKMAEFAGGADEGEANQRFNAGSSDADIDPADPFMARKVLAEANREGFAAMSGHDYSEISDAEMLDNFTYNIFPNFSPWGGFVPNIVYRWRPHKDADHCLMEVRILMRAKEGEEHPRAPEMALIPDDQPWSYANNLLGESLAGVFDQDMTNLPELQQGMKASHNKEIQLGAYQDSRVRHFHNTLGKFIDGRLPG